MKKKESTDAQLTAKNIGDRINPDSAKYIKATAAEEALLGLMLIFDEFRSAAAKHELDISADDFVTDFSRRVFLALCELESSEWGYSKAMLGQIFSADEMGRIEKIEIGRRSLSNNSRDVFVACIESIKQEKKKANSTESTGGFDDLAKMRQALKDNKNKR